MILRDAPSDLPSLRQQFELSQNASLSDVTEARLRDEIVSGILAPAARLRIDELRKRYDVGLSPLREAMNRLAEVGFIEAESHRGARVTPVSFEGLQAIVEARIPNETAALRLSISRGTEDWEARILGALHRLQRVTDRRLCALTGDRIAHFDRIELRHREFHSVLLSACASPWLQKICDTLSLQQERYFRLAVRCEGRRVLSRPELEADGYGALAQAVVSRETERACTLLTGHLQATLSAVPADHPLYKRAL